MPIVDGYRITLTIEGRQLGGTAACNGYGATLSGDTGEVLVGEIGMTAMACQPPEVMASERTYTDGLTRVSRLALSGDMLELTGSGVSLSYVRLAAVPTGELLGTVWTLETLVQGDTASSVAGAPATLQLLPDGTVAGSTGCRELTGRYVVTGDEVLFTEFSAAGECPADLQTQDNHVVSVLGDGFTVAIEGDRLTMTSSGSDGLVYHSG